MLRFSLFLLPLIGLPGYGQTEYKPTEKDTIISCTLTGRSRITGPFSESHPADFEKLVKTVFDGSPLPPSQYYIFQTKDPAMLRVGRHLYDELDYHTFFLYNIDSASIFNVKAQTRFGLLAAIAHEVGHHAFNHFKPWLNEDISIQELQADYFAGWMLAKLNVPQVDITKGLIALTRESRQDANYRSGKDRERAMLLGYQVANAAGAGPLELLSQGNEPDNAWLKKWCRIAKSPDRTSPVGEGVLAKSNLELDGSGQLRIKSNGTSYVIARAMPSKDNLFAYLLFDNQFNYWWVERDGTIKDKNRDVTLGRVDLSVVKK